MAQIRAGILDEGPRKRAAPVEPIDGLNHAKRVRLGTELTSHSNAPPLPPGPTSIAQLFTLTNDEGLSSFDVTQLPIELVVKITLPVLQQINQASLDEAISTVRSRYDLLSRAQYAMSQRQAEPSTTVDDDEDDYEPDFQPMEDSEQILNKADDVPAESSSAIPTDVALGTFKLPQPPPFTPEETRRIGKSTIDRVFRMLDMVDDSLPGKKKKSGLNRLAGSNHDQETWITIITRLATRTCAGLDDESESDGDESKDKIDSEQVIKPRLSDTIREKLLKYIVEDFRSRIHIAIMWLNEEWFNDRICGQAKIPRDKRQFPPLPVNTPIMINGW